MRLLSLFLGLISITFSVQSYAGDTTCHYWDFQFYIDGVHKPQTDFTARAEIFRGGSPEECASAMVNKYCAPKCGSYLGSVCSVKCRPFPLGKDNVACRNLIREGKGTAEDQIQCPGQSGTSTNQNCDGGYWKLSACTKNCPSKNCKQQEGCNKKWFCK